jgi:hypothetical protein
MVAIPKRLYHDVPNCTDVIAIRITEAFNSSMSQATITCYDTTLELGDAINFKIGYAGDNGKIFQGFVRNINKTLPAANTIITCEDELSKAVDYYMASNNPEAPFERSEILTEDLVEDILNEAQITSYAHSVPLSVTWGTHGTSVKFNLTSAWQAAKQIVDALAWHLYCDRNGTVHLTGTHPYIEGGEVSSFTWNDASKNITMINYGKSAEELRNRVVVYGNGDVTANASAVSPYLPAGFYKTSVVGTPIITSNEQAQQVADLNLTRFNRLTESLSLSVEGDYRITPRLWATITNTYLATSGMWFIYQVEHAFDSGGYLCNVTCTK